MSTARQLNSQSLAYWRAHPIEFIETCLYDPETGLPFVLLPAERAFLEHAFKIGGNGKLIYNEWLYSCPKKSGKTTFEAIVEITMVLLFGGAYPEAYILANDQEQAAGRVFEICKRIVQASPLLRYEATITQYKIVFPAFNATIYAIASDAGSAAGSNAVIAGFDELWAYTSERSRRLWDEMMPPPTRKIACRVTVTYAGYQGESVLLEELHKRGKEQPLIGEDLYGGDGLLMFWSHKPVAPWQDEAWATSMRRERASAYQRQFLNEFASSSSQFVDLSQWDKCVDERLGHIASDPSLPVWVGIDVGFKHDATGIAVVTIDRKANLLKLCTHYIFQPSPGHPLNFEQTLEKTLLDLHKRYQVRKVLFDPWQMQASAQRLIQAGLPIEEFPQSVPNLTACAQNLFDLIQSQGLLVYPDAAMRLAISRTIASEGSRGWKIDKAKQAHRIDIIVALAMASHAAVRDQAEPFFDRSWNWVDTDRDAPPPPTNETPQQREARQNAEWRRMQYFRHLINGPGGSLYAQRTFVWR